MRSKTKSKKTKDVYFDRLKIDLIIAQKYQVSESLKSKKSLLQTLTIKFIFSQRNKQKSVSLIVLKRVIQLQTYQKISTRGAYGRCSETSAFRETRLVSENASQFPEKVLISNTAEKIKPVTAKAQYDETDQNN